MVVAFQEINYGSPSKSKLMIPEKMDFIGKAIASSRPSEISFPSRPARTAMLPTLASTSKDCTNGLGFFPQVGTSLASLHLPNIPPRWSVSAHRANEHQSGYRIGDRRGVSRPCYTPCWKVSKISAPNDWC